MSILVSGRKNVIGITASVPKDKIELHLYGNSRQKTTTGKNLLQNKATTQTLNGGTFTVNEDGSMTINGRTTALATITINDRIELKKGNTYILTIGVYFNFLMVICDIVQKDGTVKQGAFNSYGNTTYECTEDGEYLQNIKVSAPKENYNDVKIYPMIRLSGTDDSFEPCTKGISPNPEYPQDVVTAASEGRVTVTVSGDEPNKIASATLQTPNGLAGIPVSSGGNYTDQNGQQWICDEITNEEIIKRVGKKKITSNLFWMITSYGIFYTDGIKNLGLNDASFFLCSHAIHTTKAASKMGHGETKFSATNLFYLGNNNFDNIDDFKLWLDANEVYIYYALPEPIHTPLTADEVAEIEKLQAFHPVTHITHNSDCDMDATAETVWEKKKIVSVWSNKDGEVTNVFSDTEGLVIYEVETEILNGAVVPKKEITPPNYNLMDVCVSINARNITDVFTDTMFMLTDKALNDYRYIKVEYDAIIEPWTFTYKDNSTSKNTKVVEKPVFTVEGKKNQTKFTIKTKDIQCQVAPPTIEGYTFVAIGIAPEISWAVTRITLYK